MRFDSWTIVLGLFAVSNLINGLWMLVDPAHWYQTLPAGVPDTGPLNAHFIRDIGCIFSIMGIALAAAAVRPKLRVGTLAGVTSWYAAHALVHVTDTIAGRLTVDHWMIDAPSVYLSTIVLIAITWKIANIDADEKFLT